MQKERENLVNEPVLNFNNGVDVGRMDISLEKASSLISGGMYVFKLPKDSASRYKKRG